MRARDPALASAAIFSGVPPELLRPLLGASHTRDLRNEDIVFQRGESASHAHVVLRGLVRISTLGESGKRITVEIFRDGDLFGELALIDDQPRTADATALGPARIAIIPGTAFRGLIQNSPDFALNLLRMVTNRLRRTYSLLEDASLSDLEHRFAKQVLYLVKLGASGAERIRLYSRMNQSDLADLLGATQRSIIKILNKWRTEGLAEFDGRTAQLTILDLERFRSLAEAAGSGRPADEPGARS